MKPSPEQWYDQAMLISEQIFKEGSEKEPGLEVDLLAALPPALQEWVRLTYQSSLTRAQALAQWKTTNPHATNPPAPGSPAGPPRPQPHLPNPTTRTRADFDRAAILVEGIVQGFFIGRASVFEDWYRKRRDDPRNPSQSLVPSSLSTKKNR